MNDSSSMLFEDPLVRARLRDRLDEDGLALWCLKLEDADAPVAELEATLDPDERRRWQQFRSPVHRRRFLLAHGMMRRVLAVYAGVASQALRFVANPLGKPMLAPPHSRHEPLHFSLSRSGELALLAISRREVGVDIETAREDAGSLALAEHLFSGDDVAALSISPRFGYDFLRCWTAKEAVVKCVGMGLSLPLDGFSTLNSDCTVRRRVEIATGPGSVTQEAFGTLAVWSLEQMPGFIGAVALPSTAQAKDPESLSLQVLG